MIKINTEENRIEGLSKQHIFDILVHARSVYIYEFNKKDKRGDIVIFEFLYPFHRAFKHVTGFDLPSTKHVDGFFYLKNTMPYFRRVCKENGADFNKVDGEYWDTFDTKVRIKVFDELIECAKSDLNEESQNLSK